MFSTTKQLCRTCLSSNNDLIPLTSAIQLHLESDFTMTVKEALFSLSFIKEIIGNNIEDNICPPCLEKVTISLQFKLLCKKSEIILQRESLNNTILNTTQSEEIDFDTKLFTLDSDLPNEINVNKKTLFNTDEKQNTPPITKNITNHNKLQHSNKQKQKTYVCTLCGKTLKSRNGYYIHMKLHNGIKNHVCPMCGMKFVASNSLTVHMRIHTADKPFHCKFSPCDKTFQTKAAMETHVRSIHTLERPYHCDLCPASFSSYSNLSKHKRSHEGIKPETCTICNKSFVSKQSLKKHLRLHSGERPHCCKICGDKLISSSALSTHTQVKHMAKQHQCYVCQKYFHLATVLKKHLKIHTRDIKT